MEGTSHKLLSLFLAVAIAYAVRGEWHSGDCVKSLYGDDGSRRCVDFDTIIDCFKNATNLPEVSKMPFMKSAVEDEIKHFESLKKKDTCEGMLKNGTCLAAEVEKCQAHTNGGANGIGQMCLNAKKASTCLGDLKSKCGNSLDVVSPIKYIEKLVEDCESGKYKHQIEEEKCQNKIRNCTDEYFAFMGKEQWDEACAKVQSSASCLENAESACSGRVHSLKTHLNFTSGRCASGMLTGKCSYNAVQNCTSTVMGKSSFGFDPCDVSNVNAAKTCLSELKPFCKTKKQLANYTNMMNSVSMMCYRPH